MIPALQRDTSQRAVPKHFLKQIIKQFKSLVKRKRKGKRKMRYLVTFTGRRSEIIKAHDDEEAIQIAQAMAFDAGIDVDVDCVQRLKPIKRYNTYNPDDAPRYEYV